MRYIGISILLVLCLTLLLLTGCIVNTVIPEIASGNLENQENTEEPVEDNPPSSSTGYVKWSGLGMGVFSTENTSEFDGYVDTLLANGFTEIRVDLSTWNYPAGVARTKVAAISAVAKGANVIWGVGQWNGIPHGQPVFPPITAANWEDYRQAILDAAQWAQDNGVYEFQIGNEEELHIDGTTMTVAGIITNLKSVAIDVQEIFTNGNVSYSCWQSSIDDWRTAGKGDIDILASNVYIGGEGYYDNGWKTRITNLVNGFGVNGTYLTEFAPSWSSLDDYSADETVQTAAVTEMIEYIKASGMTRASYFAWKYEAFGVLKDDGTYRLLWNQALLNTGPVESTTVPAKTATVSLPNTIALMPK